MTDQSIIMCQATSTSRRNTTFATTVWQAVSAARRSTGRPPTALEIGTGGAAMLSLVAVGAGWDVASPSEGIVDPMHIYI